MGTNYEIVVFYSAEDRTYVAEAPSLKGCVADGKTCAEALANVDVVIHKWMDSAKAQGKALPKHRRIMFA
jgi:predicted RNase H-like HicB family nuclease